MFRVDFVYALVDADEVGYVGVTDDPKGRYYQHINVSGKNAKKDEWVERKIRAGITPEMRILEVVYNNRPYAEKMETFWITYFAAMENRLTNIQKTRGLYGEEAFVRGLEKQDLGDMYEFDFRINDPNTFDMPRTILAWIDAYRAYYDVPLYWLSGRRDLQRLDRFQEIWASLGILPLAESVIIQLLNGAITLYDISAAHLLPPTPGQAYCWYISQAACRPSQGKDLTLLFARFLSTLADHGIRIDKLYACISDDVNEAPLLYLAKEHGFLYQPIISSTAWLLPIESYNPSLIVRSYQHRISQV